MRRFFSVLIMDKKKISIAVVAVLVCLLICIAAIGQLVPKDRDPEEGSDTALPAEVLDLINNYMSAFKKGTDKSVEYIYMEDEFKRSAYINSGDMLIDYKIESFEKINNNLYGLVVLTKTEQSMMTFGDVYRSVFNFVAYIDGEWRYINGVANIPADIRENLDVSKYTYDDEHIVGAEDIVGVIDSDSKLTSN